MTRQQAFEDLYRLHHGEVFRAALRATGDRDEAEDITQSAFADAYRAWSRGTVPREPRAWLFAIATNVRKRRWLARSRRPAEVELDDADAVSRDADAPSARELRAVLAELPERQRRVVLLRELGGLSYEEIAVDTGLSAGSVQMLLFRARRTLREQLASARGLTLLPGWLGQLVSRIAEAGPVLRGAGALGAVAIGGALVHTTGDGAHGRTPPSQPPSLHAVAPPAPHKAIQVRADSPHVARQPQPPARAATFRASVAPGEATGSRQPEPEPAQPASTSPPIPEPTTTAVHSGGPAPSPAATPVTVPTATVSAPSIVQISTPPTANVPSEPLEAPLPPVEVPSLAPAVLPSAPLVEGPSLPSVAPPPLPAVTAPALSVTPPTLP